MGRAGSCRSEQLHRDLTGTVAGLPRIVGHLHAIGGNEDVPLIGAMKGKIEISDDFDEMPAEFMVGLSAPTVPE